MAPTHPTDDAPPKLAMKGFSLSVLSKSSSSAKGNGSPSTKSSGRFNENGSPKSSLGKRPRNGFSSAYHSDDSGSEHEGTFQNRSADKQNRGTRKDGFEEVAGLEHGRAVLKDEDQRRARGRADELVIPKMQNKDWRGETRARNEALKGKNLLPPKSRHNVPRRLLGFRQRRQRVSMW